MRWNIFSNAKQTKGSPVTDNAALALFTDGKSYQKHNAKALLEEGYAENPTIYRCINEVSKNAAQIPIDLKDSRNKRIPSDPILDLLNNPNPTQNKKRFVEELCVDYLTLGNSYIAASSEIKPKELWRLDPLKMTVVPGKSGIPKAYIYNKNTPSEKIFPVDQLTGKSQVLHQKTINPLDPWYGLPPLQIAAVSGDLHNSGLKWNYNLLRNGGRPSGVLEMDGNPSENALNKLKKLKDTILGGPHNAGKIPILSGGIKWKSLSESPKDMDFATSLTAADRYIAMVYGVPLPLISTDASTFNNVELAQEKLYEDTIIPLLFDFISSLNMWLVPMFGKEVILCYNLDKVQALQSRRKRLFDRAKAAVDSGIITRNEAREMMDFETLDGGADELLVSSQLIPINFAGESQENTNAPIAQDNQKLFDALLGSGYNEAEAVNIMRKDFGVLAIEVK